MDGKVALVTGAARGMGCATARLFAAEGAKVVLADLRDDLGAKVAAEIGSAARFVRHDVSSEVSWQNVVAETTRAFGALDILVNNAAIIHSASLADETVEGFLDLLKVNVIGVFLGMRTATAALRAAGNGAIVNVCSNSAAMGVPQFAAYATAKWGVRGLTKTAALELAPLGIRVNSIYPGVTDTAMIETSAYKVGGAMVPGIPLNRLGQPEDIAQAALYLASAASSYITGGEIFVDGGMLLGPIPFVNPVNGEAAL